MLVGRLFLCLSHAYALEFCWVQLNNCPGAVCVWVWGGGVGVGVGVGVSVGVGVGVGTRQVLLNVYWFLKHVALLCTKARV